jgi:hypothetical protein
MFTPVGLKVCDVLYAFHPDDLNQLEKVCTDMMTNRWRKIEKMHEHEFYDAVGANFATIKRKWVAGREFNIVRIDGTVVQHPPVNTIVYSGIIGVTVLGSRILCKTT